MLAQFRFGSTIDPPEDSNWNNPEIILIWAINLIGMLEVTMSYMESIAGEKTMNANFDGKMAKSAAPPTTDSRASAA